MRSSAESLISAGIYGWHIPALYERDQLLCVTRESLDATTRPDRSATTHDSPTRHLFVFFLQFFSQLGVCLFLWLTQQDATSFFFLHARIRALR